MGYTHYMKNKPAFTDAQWAAFCNDVRDIFNKYRLTLANGAGDARSKPYIGRGEISFNGRGEDSHETGYVPKAATEFEFCKTAHKPYDVVVVEVYKLVRKYLPDAELSSDGGDEIFGGQKIRVNNKWTYLTGDYEVGVGDTVTLPAGQKYSDRTWEGTVTEIGSTYDGDCKYILGVVAKAPVVGPLDHVDPDAQISTEEEIAAMLADEYAIHEEVAADMSRKALLIVAKRLGVK